MNGFLEQLPVCLAGRYVRDAGNGGRGIFWGFLSSGRGWVNCTKDGHYGEPVSDQKVDKGIVSED